MLLKTLSSVRAGGVIKSILSRPLFNLSFRPIIPSCYRSKKFIIASSISTDESSVDLLKKIFNELQEVKKAQNMVSVDIEEVKKTQNMVSVDMQEVKKTQNMVSVDMQEVKKTQNMVSVDMQEVKNTVFALQKDQSVSSMVTPSEYAYTVEKKFGIKITSLSARVGGASFLSQKAVNKLAKLRSEHEILIHLVPYIKDLLEDNYEVVDTEKFQWIKTLSEQTKHYQKPDLLISHIQLHESPSKSDDTHTEKITSLTDPSKQFDYQFLLGKGIWDIKDMYPCIWDVKNKLAPEDRGSMYSYLLYLSRDDPFNSYTGIVADSSEFIIVKCQNTTITAVSRGKFSDPGSNSYLAEAMSHKNSWLLSLEEICDKLGLKVNGYLGKGKYGRCFNVTDHSGKSLALKLVNLNQYDRDEASLIAAATEREYNKLVELGSKCAAVIKVKESSLVKISGEVSAMGYLMSEVGDRLSREDWLKSNKVKELLVSLNMLHKAGHYHGDTRLANVILVNDKPTWIDVMLGDEEIGTNLQKRKDMEKLLCSLMKIQAVKEVDGMMKLLDTYETGLNNVDDLFQACDNFNNNKNM